MPVGQVVAGPVMTRHGWQEQGGRQVGVYGQAWHAGQCFGVGWTPFELSTAGTVAFITQVLFPRALTQENALAHLATRPPLIIDFENEGYLPGSSLVGKSREKYKAPYQARLVDGFPGAPRTTLYVGNESIYLVGLSSYQDALQSEIDQHRALLGSLRREALDCFAAISTWKLGELRDEERVPTRHYKNEGARVPFCGSRSHGIFSTDDESIVTCSRCKKALDADKALAAKNAQVRADSAALTEWLTKLGKHAKIAEIKKGLGWDTKRINAAFDVARRAKKADHTFWLGNATGTWYFAPPLVRT
jgi:hypothetical protein